MTDGTVQAPADSTGKLVDADELTVAEQTVVRFRVEMPGVVRTDSDLFDLILQEIQLTNELLAQAFGLGRELEALRTNGD